MSAHSVKSSLHEVRLMSHQSDYSLLDILELVWFLRHIQKKLSVKLIITQVSLSPETE